MARHTKRTIIINDPVHSVMNFGSDEKVRKALKAVIDSKPFQRLRRISQLGLASYVFPGTTHTRFNHSLGAAYTAYRIFSHLQEQETELRKEIRRFKLPVLLSMLLHDIGHGPFSHSFEKVLKRFDKIKSPPLHEEWTHEIITNKVGAIAGILKSLKLDASLIGSPFCDNPEKKYPLYLKQIVSSQLDADRMDYLERDSHFAGVSLGKFDSNYLIDCMTVIKHGQSKEMTLGITTKGVKCYEAFLVARHLMNQSIYYHPKIKMHETMMEHFLMLVIKHADLLSNKKAFEGLVPSYLVSIHELLSKPKKFDRKEFISNNLDNYLELTEDRIWALLSAIASSDVPAKLNQAKEIATGLLTRAKFRCHKILDGKVALFQKSLDDKKLISGQDYVIVSTKSTMYENDSDENTHVFVDDGERQMEVTKHSDMISLFRDRSEKNQLLVVLRPNLNKKIQEIGKTVSALENELNIETLAA